MTHESIPLVSICIPTYNRAERYLRECIQTAVDQTYPNIEIIVSDNCSTDNTQEIVESFGEKRIQYVRHAENIGPINNFNYCLQAAKGDFFLLLHDDDQIDHDFVETCMQAANFNKDIGLIISGTRLIDSEGRAVKEMPNRAVGPSTEDLFISWFNHKTALYLCSTLFNTMHLKAIGGFASRHNLFLDVFAEVKIAAAHGRVDVEAVKASFRKHEGELTFAARVGAWCEDSLDLLDLICELTKERKALILEQGSRFFCDLNFKRAMAVNTPSGRLSALLVVIKHYGYRFFVLRRFLHCLRASAKEFVFQSHD